MRLFRIIAVILLALASVGAQTASPPKTAAVSSEVAGLIDINRASAGELKTLPGIGDAYSLAIVKRRPYKNKTQLRSMGVIPPAAYQKIKDKIIAKQ